MRGQCLSFGHAYVIIRSGGYSRRRGAGRVATAAAAASRRVPRRPHGAVRWRFGPAVVRSPVAVSGGEPLRGGGLSQVRVPVSGRILERCGRIAFPRGRRYPVDQRRWQPDQGRRHRRRMRHRVEIVQPVRCYVTVTAADRSVLRTKLTINNMHIPYNIA